MFSERTETAFSSGNWDTQESGLKYLYFEIRSYQDALAGLQL